jgi:phosphatidylglycerophosphate synthase
MFDDRMRVVKDTVFNPMAEVMQMVPPWLFSVLGLIAGVGAALAAWQQAYLLAVLLWWLNRILDGFDGAVARITDSQSDFGGYLDIILDYVVYAAVPIGLAFGRMDTAVTYALIFLLSTFYVNGASWMYLAAILEKRSHQHANRLTSVVMPAGLVGGTETIIFYSVFIIFPGVLVWSFSLMAVLVAITVIQRLVWAIRHLT